METTHASSCLMEEGVELCRAVWQHNQGTLPGSGPARTSGQVSRLLVQCSLWEGEGAMQMLGFGTRQGGPGLSCGLAKRSVDCAFMPLYLLSQSPVYPQLSCPLPAQAHSAFWTVRDLYCGDQRPRNPYPQPSGRRVC